MMIWAASLSPADSPGVCGQVDAACVAQFNPAVSMRFKPFTPPSWPNLLDSFLSHHQRLANDRWLPADHGGAARLNQWRGAEIELPEVGKHADNQSKTPEFRAADADDRNRGRHADLRARQFRHLARHKAKRANETKLDRSAARGGVEYVIIKR